MFSESFFLQVFKWPDCVVKGYGNEYPKPAPD